MPVATNEEFVDAILDAAEQGPAGTAAISGAEARANLLNWLEQWTDGSVLPAALANKFARTLTDWDAFTNGIWQLFNTPANGGPNNDGIVVVYDHLGTEYSIPGYQLMADLMEKGDPGSTTADASIVFKGISGWDASDTFKFWKATTDVTIVPADCAGDADNGSTLARVFTFYKGGAMVGSVLTGATLLGTMTFTAAGNGAAQSAVVDFDETEIEKGDFVWLTCPASDATLADILLVFSTTRVV